MERHVVILGGGTAGTLAANRLRRELPTAEFRITVVDRDDDHIYRPGLLFVPFGLARVEELVRPRRRQFQAGVDFLEAQVQGVDVAGATVRLEDGTGLDYDALVVASGAPIAPDETPGLTGPGWMENLFTFYSAPGAAALAAALAAFDGGRLAVVVADLPITCPVAPLEFCFLADWYFQQRHLRERVELTYVTPLDAAFTTPVAAEALGGLLDAKGIECVTGFDTADVDGAAATLTAFDGRSVGFDLAVVVPPHGGAGYVERSEGLGDPLGFVMVDPHTLQAEAAPNVFAVGDAAALPTSKAGSAAHFEGEVLAHNVTRYLRGLPLDARYDGHVNCFVETGFGKALLVDFNYDHEPVAGRYPAGVGLPLLREARVNHLGKRMFEWLYWHMLLAGRSLPGLGSAMPVRGKQAVPAP